LYGRIKGSEELNTEVEMAFKVQRYGWRPDRPDHRDLQFKATPKILKALPASIDLRPQMPPVFDQGDLGSCTANAACALVWYTGLKEGHPSVEPSRLFEYWNTRAIEGTTREDSGASIRDSIKAMVQRGFAPEADWPYHIGKFKAKPPAIAYSDAKKNLIRQYHSVPQTAAQIKSALAQNLPVDFGFTVYESFEGDAVASTGIVPMPSKNESVVGGHAVLIVGYDDSKNAYIVRNSWGSGWGIQGYCYMLYDYIHSQRLASDFWVINAVP
jgi:C1A family cysteine protease